MNEDFTIKTVVFDLGGVLIDWDPRHLYRKVFDEESVMETFLSEVCTHDWNELQDAGRSLEEATKERIGLFPEFKKEISAFYGRWEEMLAGPIEPTVSLLKEIVSGNEHQVVALTNWSAETFPIARNRFAFLDAFEDIVISGVEKVKKPDSRIYRILIERTGLDPATSLFIDDSARNIVAAQKLGFRTHHFKSSLDTGTIRELLSLEDR